MRWRTAGALIAAFALGTVSPALPDRAGLKGYVGAYRWAEDDPDFGGFSAIEVAPDGEYFAALTDRGAIATGKLRRDAGGVITGVDASRPMPLAEPIGPVPENYAFDTEGLALSLDGSFYVSTESIARVLQYRRSDEVPRVLPIAPDFVLMPGNRSLEALAIDASGSLFTLPEVSQRTDGNYPVYRFKDGAWDQPFLIRRLGSFLPAGADFGPDGRLYLLERQFNGLAGFSSRVRRIEITESGIAPDEILLETAPGTFGNMEGIAVWRDGDDAIRLTLISDDNFLSVLGTEIVEFRVPD